MCSILVYLVCSSISPEVFVALLDRSEESGAVVTEEEVVLEEEVQAEVAQVRRPAHRALVVNGGGDVEAGAHVGDSSHKNGGAASDSSVVLLIRCLKFIRGCVKLALGAHGIHVTSHSRVNKDM